METTGYFLVFQFDMTEQFDKASEKGHMISGSI